jgi:hypothetical protein
MFSRLFLLLSASLAVAATVPVRTDAELRAALQAAKPGDRIEVAPGDYTGGLHLPRLRGESGRPIVLTAADPQRPPHFRGGGSGIHFVDPAFLEISHLVLTGATGNGLSLDDGGTYSPAPRGIVLRGLHVSAIGPRGNADALKLSGIDGFRIEDCTLEHWGSGSGSGIDLVGCHDGLITRCTLRHTADLRTTGGSGIQAKGGSRGILIRQNRFEHAGQRAVNLGGSTGFEFFRPPLTAWPGGVPRTEAADLTVEGNTFIGSLAPICFVGVDGAKVRFNTFYDPGKWVIRILQETKDAAFVPSRGGHFTDNLVVFASRQWSEGGINIGAGTAPETFQFARNHWHCRDDPSQSRPRLPRPETGGSYGGEPQFLDATAGDLRQKPTSPARTHGADALPATL